MADRKPCPEGQHEWKEGPERGTMIIQRRDDCARCGSFRAVILDCKCDGANCAYKKSNGNVGMTLH